MNMLFESHLPKEENLLKNLKKSMIIFIVMMDLLHNKL